MSQNLLTKITSDPVRNGGVRVWGREGRGCKEGVASDGRTLLLSCGVAPNGPSCILSAFPTHVARTPMAMPSFYCSGMRRSAVGRMTHIPGMRSTWRVVVDWTTWCIWRHEQLSSSRTRKRGWDKYHQNEVSTKNDLKSKEWKWGALSFMRSQKLDDLWLSSKSSKKNFRTSINKWQLWTLYRV